MKTCFSISADRSFRLGLRLFSVILVGGLTACGSLLSSSGPSISAISSTENQNYSLIDINPQTLLQSLRQREQAPKAGVAAAEVPDIRLVSGDSLKILITDSSPEGAIFAPLASGGTVFENVRVDSRGEISLPYVGKRNVKGRTLSELETLIRRSIASVATDPQVHLELTGDLSNSVLVAGAVKQPGRFSALSGPLTLLDAINGVGGPSLDPHLARVIVRTGSAAKVYNYESLLRGGNVAIEPNSEVVVERDRQSFVAMGAVAQPGLHDLPSSNPSLLEVLGLAGGLRDTQADASGVFVFRLTPAPLIDGRESEIEARAEVYRLNMKDPAAIFMAREFRVQPDDAVYVTNAAVYEWQKIISPIVQVLILGRTVNAGF